MTHPPDRLILGSGSPRRRQLLDAAGYRFDVIVPSDAAEAGFDPEGVPPEQLVVQLARRKAIDVAERIEGPAIVLGCDTVAECDGRILGKPTDRDDARAMLKSLSGQRHRVLSGLCICSMPSGEIKATFSETILLMDPLTDEQIEGYLDSGQWEGKAGAFGYQDGIEWIHIEQGSESNVVGLPMELLAMLLTKVRGKS